MTESVIKGIQVSKERAAAIIDAANKRKEALLASTHDTAKKHIQGIKTKNADSLEELKDTLKKENDQKEEEVKVKTANIIITQEKNGEAHLDELVDLLYNTVINVSE